MFVFLHGDGVRSPPDVHYMFVTPAAQEPNTEMPVNWVDSHNRPRTFEVIFLNGRAEVADDLGRFMIKQGNAHERSSSLFRSAA